MVYDPKAIANYFLKVAEEQGEPLTPMKLQKLVYYANGWHLAINDEPLINEQVEAWSYGPVVPSLYHEFRRFGDQAITEQAFDMVTESDDPWEMALVRLEPTIDDRPNHADFARAFLDRIWETYSGYSAIQLSNETHRPGSPWDTVRKQYNGAIPKRTDIPSDLMKEYFRALSRSKAKAQ
jgi:uncharacterized phage-associated protein